VVLNDVRSTLTNRRHRAPTSGPKSANTGLLLPFSFDQLIGCDENGLWYGKAILQAIDMPDGEPLNLAS
jgi:hypothetical protein